MPATLESPPLAEKLSEASLLESVRALSPEDKQVVFLALLREALEINGDTGLLPIDDEEGRSFGYYVPPKAAEERYKLYGPQLSEAEEAEIAERVRNPGPAIPLSDVIVELKRELAELQHQQS